MSNVMHQSPWSDEIVINNNNNDSWNMNVHRDRDHDYHRLSLDFSAINLSGEDHPPQHHQPNNNISNNVARIRGSNVVDSNSNINNMPGFWESHAYNNNIVEDERVTAANPTSYPRYHQNMGSPKITFFGVSSPSQGLVSDMKWGIQKGNTFAGVSQMGSSIDLGNGNTFSANSRFGSSAYGSRTSSYEGPSNPLLTDGGLSTVIAKSNGSSGEFLSSSLGRWQNRGSNPDRGLILAFKTIATMSERLRLVATIQDRANEIYKRVEDQKSSRGRNQDALLAACIYIACRQEDIPRTVKEICSVANGASKKEIGRAKEYIVKQLGLERDQTSEATSDTSNSNVQQFEDKHGDLP